MSGFHDCRLNLNKAGRGLRQGSPSQGVHIPAHLNSPGQLWPLLEVAMVPTYVRVSRGAAAVLGYQTVTDKDPRVFGGDGQALMQNLNQSDPEVEDGLRMVRVEP